jgi:hypothetical protein
MVYYNHNIRKGKKWGNSPADLFTMGFIEGMSVVCSTWRMKKEAHVDHYIRNNNIKADGAKMNGVIAH